MGRKLIVFADGTGNAFSTRESNVWRLYEALDRSSTDQVARYIKGVGTSGLRPLAVLDSATGVGVPSNVRALYRFLCWNWSPGDEIYMFGFSRGAFTVRTLAALISSQGLVSSEIDGVQVSTAKMKRNAMAAWRAYRSEIAPSKGRFPTIRMARLVRDAAIAALDMAFPSRGPSYRSLQEMNRMDVRINFLGVFDTVEAYGVPFEELRDIIDHAVWPMAFRNGALPKIANVARHALSLDDERLTFHPKPFDPDTSGERDVEEVWFAGVHSDVGGGYQDAALSFIPLVWMADQAAQRFTDSAGNVRASGLRFRQFQVDEYRAMQLAQSPIHDSRTGLAVMYRYEPRKLPDDAVLDESVAMKVALGPKDYAPTVLHGTARIKHDGGLVNVTGWVPPGMTTPPLSLDGDYLERMRDLVWLRHKAYIALLLAVTTVAASPWLLHWAGSEQGGAADAARRAVGSVGGFAPGWAEPWVRVVADHPLLSAMMVAIAALLYAWNGSLRASISDHARLAWFAGSRAKHTPTAAGRTIQWVRSAKAFDLRIDALKKRVLRN